MAEFVQIMKDMRRMCDAHASNCCECPLASYECCCIPKDRVYFTDKQVEGIVATWAAEHPEPVYPTWGTWLAEKYDFDLREIMYAPIPADIAKKLGIEPKEGT